MRYTYLILGLLTLPTFTHAQGMNDFIVNITIFISSTLIPFLFGMAFLVFVINAIRFFVVQSNNQEGREKAKALIIYSVLAFVFLVIFWGIINLLSNSLGLTGYGIPSEIPVSDYIPQDRSYSDCSNGGPC